MKLYVVAHKNTFEQPKYSELYKLIQVGTSLNNNFDGNWIYDNEGDNISERNIEYNELTAAYWIWKNSNEDYVGLCHYRRYFVYRWAKLGNLIFLSKNGLIDEKYIRKVLARYDAIVHKKTFFPKGNLQQYKNRQLGGNDFCVVRDVISEVYPDYSYALEKVLLSKTGHMFNMIITSKNNYNVMCEWMFGVLFEVEKRLKNCGEINFSRRMGMLGERLMDVWLEKNQLKLFECSTINTEKRTLEFWAE